MEPVVDSPAAPLLRAGRIERARRALALLVETDPERREAEHRELFADDFRIEVPVRTGCQVYSALERGEFKRGSIEIVEMLESGSRVLSHVRVQAVRQHEVCGELVTQECTADGIVTYGFEGELEGGRIIRAWSMLRWR